MEKVKWGILGTAKIARGAAIPGMHLAESCDLYAIAGRSAEKAARFAEEFGFTRSYGSYEDLVADPDVQAVYIPLPNHLHLKWVLAVLKAGKHVLCEKPLALNVAEAEEMYRTAAECGVHLMEAYAYLHSPYVASLKQDLQSGIIGEVDYIETAFVTQSYKEDFRLHKEFGGGAMYDLGCYCTTMLLTLTDSNPVFVKAVAEFTDPGVDCQTAAILRFENGIRAAFNVGMALGEDSNARFDRLYIHGTKGSIRSDVEYNQSGALSYRIFTADGVTEKTVQVPQNYALEAEQLSRCILYGEKPLITPEFSLKNARLIDRVLREIGYSTENGGNAKMYCEKCCHIIEGDRCPVCKSRKVRKPEAKDICFLTEQDYLSSGILEDLLKQNGIPALKKDVMGAGMAIRVGPMLEYSRFYVPFEHLEAAKAIVDDLFSDARGEITEQ